MDESKPQESGLFDPQIACTSSAHYPTCASIKRKPLPKEIDPAIAQEFSVNFDLLPLVEAKIHNYKYMKHVSLETNELLKCRWKAYKGCLGYREHVPFHFPSADDFHFYKFHTRYIPSEAVTNKDHRRQRIHDLSLDDRSHGYVPNKLHFRYQARKIVKPKGEVKPKKGY